MKAAVMTKPYSIEFHDIPRPEPASGEVLVKIKAAGICGSDVHFTTAQIHMHSTLRSLDMSLQASLKNGAGVRGDPQANGS
ncbi:alcohol dehydrogenase catalytic domain-containing protein [Bacillus licheniformis]|nr:alcohol dehydrogenase catalytic domain-containing protein [Bacillus licheniformis]